MAQESQAPPMGSRNSNLKKSFLLGIRSLLTAFSKEDVHKAFSSFNNAEIESLYRMFVQVTKSLHESIEAICLDNFHSAELGLLCVLTTNCSDHVGCRLYGSGGINRAIGARVSFQNCSDANLMVEFESICQETKVGTTLDMIEQLVEEQSLDILSTDKTKIEEVEEKMLMAKKDEIHHLTSLLQKAEEQNNIMKARIESLKVKQDLLVTADVVDKVRSWTSNYESQRGS